MDPNRSSRTSVVSHHCGLEPAMPVICLVGYRCFRLLAWAATRVVSHNYGRSLAWVVVRVALSVICVVSHHCDRSLVLSVLKAALMVISVVGPRDLAQTQLKVLFL